MKKKAIRRALALVIALTLAAMPLTVYADNDPTSAVPDVSAPVAASDPSSDDNNAGGGSAEASDDDSRTPAVNVIETNPKIESNGQTLKTEIEGAYLTKNVQVVFQQSLIENESALPKKKSETLKEGKLKERIQVKTYEFDDKKAPLAAKSLKLCAISAGASAGPLIHVEFYKNQGPKLVKLEGGTSLRTKMVVKPKNITKLTQATIKNPQDTLPKKKLALAKVVEGGDVEILENKSDDPDLIISDITCEDASYAVIEYNE